ncbi:MAG: lytic transglycosylase domain-containing protein [Xanthobacteraceae bacterium]|nr:MAG: lytic transglycosylase domain-containing protein [Xanthobacteraceae bacterium]
MTTPDATSRRGMKARALATIAVMFAFLAPQSHATPLPKPRPLPRGEAKTNAKTGPKTDPKTNAKNDTRTGAKAAAATAGTPPAPAKQVRARAPFALAATAATPQQDVDALEKVIEQVRARNSTQAAQTVAAIGDPVARKLAEWIFLRSDNNNVSAERYRAFISANPSWPGLNFLRRRGEAALWDDRRDDAAVLSWFAGEAPLSGKGKFVLARARLARGDRAGAERLVRDAWRGDEFSKDVESTALEQFGALLNAGDHKARLEFLLFKENSEAALRAAHRLGAGAVAMARARLAVINKAGNAKALLDAVPAEARGEPGYVFARAQWLRRNDKIAEAAQVMAHAPREPARLGNLDEWWVERRVLARKLLDDNNPQLAYAIARDAATPARAIYKTEHEFTAGWIALRFLNDPATAAQHFSRLGVGTVNPTALARAGYWQGRAAEALGRGHEARAAYEAASRQSTSYYGQLARARLGLPQLALNPAPVPRNATAARLEIVRAVELLYALEESDLAVPMLAELGEQAGDGDALAAIAELATRARDARGLLLVGKGALNHGLPFDHHAYPVIGIPAFASIGPEVEKSIVYAIARQESAFNQKVVSPANAMGLMQVTPAAGRQVAKKFGVGFDVKRLMSDPAYNASFGAAELAELLENYRGSYILTFAAYNAGRGRIRDWLAKYGDPRDPGVDAVDWVERIPFSETRNYVQRILENLQVYRARFGGGSKLMIEADLRRGASVE